MQSYANTRQELINLLFSGVNKPLSVRKEINGLMVNLSLQQRLELLVLFETTIVNQSGVKSSYYALLADALTMLLTEEENYHVLTNLMNSVSGNWSNSGILRSEKSFLKYYIEKLLPLDKFKMLVDEELMKYQPIETSNFENCAQDISNDFIAYFIGYFLINNPQFLQAYCGGKIDDEKLKLFFREIFFNEIYPIVNHDSRVESSLGIKEENATKQNRKAEQGKGKKQKKSDEKSNEITEKLLSFNDLKQLNFPHNSSVNNVARMILENIHLILSNYVLNNLPSAPNVIVKNIDQVLEEKTARLKLLERTLERLEKYRNKHSPTQNLFDALDNFKKLLHDALDYCSKYENLNEQERERARVLVNDVLSILNYGNISELQQDNILDVTRVLQEKINSLSPQEKDFGGLNGLIKKEQFVLKKLQKTIHNQNGFVSGAIIRYQQQQTINRMKSCLKSKEFSLSIDETYSTQLAKVVSMMKFLTDLAPKSQLLTNGSDQFVRFRMPSDGDCGYHALGITRKDAHQLVINYFATLNYQWDQLDKLDENAQTILNILKISIKGELIGNRIAIDNFYNYLLSLNLQNANYSSANVIHALQSFDNGNADELDTLCINPAIVTAFINYEMQIGRWASTSILQVVAIIAGINLLIWRPDASTGELELINQFGYGVIRSQQTGIGANNVGTGYITRHVIFEQHHFDRLIPVVEVLQLGSVPALKKILPVPTKSVDSDTKINSNINTKFSVSSTNSTNSSNNGGGSTVSQPGVLTRSLSSNSFFRVPPSSQVGQQSVHHANHHRNTQNFAGDLLVSTMK